MHVIPYDQVSQIKWKGSSVEYDGALHALDCNRHDQFLVVNFDFIKSDLDNFNYLEFNNNKIDCITWSYNGAWVAKLFPRNWKIGHYKNIYLKDPVIKLKWEQNPDISASVEFENDPRLTFILDSWDCCYELIWYVANTDIWIFKCQAHGRTPKSVKHMGELIPKLSKTLDVIFISYKESNAEENWQRVLEKAPYAKRVDGVEGIFNAHKAAALLSTTDMFYVVDGDAWLVDDFNFDFCPLIYDRECTHIWHSKNPINNLSYGYGGVKLFSKQVIDNANSWTTLDMATTVGSKLKIIDKISNITSFNTDEFSTWKGAFRECVKLSYNIQQRPNDTDSINRLESWMAPSDAPFAKYAIDAAQEAKEWVLQNPNNLDMLRLINNRNWIETQFKLRNTNE